MSNTRKKSFHEWESSKPGGDDGIFIRMSNSQLLHPAFNMISHSAVNVYMHMKLESKGHIEFEMPYSKYKKFISKQGFQDAKKELVNSGFIEIAQNNANLRKPNKYRFSSNWWKE